MQTTTPHIWFDTQAEEAARFYISIFPDSKLGAVARYPKAGEEVSGKKAGSVMTVEFEIMNQAFIALNGGPQFSINPSISFSVSCDSEEEIDIYWQKLADGGEALMPLQEYPFSKKYGWVKDKFGVTWQLNFDVADQKIRTSLMFTGKNFGRCEEAMKFYTSIFPNSMIKEIHRYEKGEHDKEGMIKHAVFSLNGEDYIAMESSYEHAFDFNEAVSLLVACKDQKEIDDYWSKLIADGGSEGPCGWCKDRFGVSWQVTPANMGEFFTKSDPAKVDKAMAAMLTMKKIDMQALEEAAK